MVVGTLPAMDLNVVNESEGLTAAFTFVKVGVPFL